MRGSGVCLFIMSVVGLTCLSSGSRAENIFEMIFGGGHHPAESHKASDAPRRVSALGHRHTSLRHAAHKGSDGAKADGPSPATMKLSYAEVWGGMSGEAAKGGVSAQDMIAKVTQADPTLRRGDAFMTPDGLQIYVGDRENDRKFVPVGEAPEISRAMKERLQAMEKTTGTKATQVWPAKLRVAAASIAEKAPATKDRLIQASNGKTIRLVGGYAN